MFDGSKRCLAIDPGLSMTNMLTLITVFLHRHPHRHRSFLLLIPLLNHILLFKEILRGPAPCNHQSNRIPWSLLTVSRLLPSEEFCLPGFAEDWWHGSAIIGVNEKGGGDVEARGWSSGDVDLVDQTDPQNAEDDAVP